MTIWTIAQPLWSDQQNWIDLGYRSVSVTENRIHAIKSQKSSTLLLQHNRFDKFHQRHWKLRVVTRLNLSLLAAPQVVTILGFHISGLSSTGATFIKQGLTVIPAWINNYIHCKVWCENTYPFLKIEPLKCWEWISNFNPHFTGYVITRPCCHLILTVQNSAIPF